MTSKNKSVLGLSLTDQIPSFSLNTSLIPYTPNHGRAVTRDQRRILDEYNNQTMVMGGFRGKTNYAMSQMAKIQQHGAITFGETLDVILALKEGHLSQEHQAYIDEFCTRSIQMLARHLFSVMEVGATNIAAEVHRPLYPEPEPPSFFKRLFG